MTIVRIFWRCKFAVKIWGALLWPGMSRRIFVVYTIVDFAASVPPVAFARGQEMCENKI